MPSQLKQKDWLAVPPEISVAVGTAPMFPITPFVAPAVKALVIVPAPMPPACSPQQVTVFHLIVPITDWLLTQVVQVQVHPIMKSLCSM